MDLNNISFTTTPITLTAIIKYGLACAFFLYGIFAFVIFTQIKATNKLVTIRSRSLFLQRVSLVHILIAFSLFFAALVIL